MWAQQLVRPCTFQLVEVNAPREADLADGDVAVRMQAGAICGSDLPSVRGEVSNLYPGDEGELAAGIAGFPLHEVVGEVVASRSDLQVGQRVVGWARESIGLAEVIVTPAAFLLPISHHADPVSQTMIQPLACVLWAVDRLAHPRGRSVAVIGQGPLGILFSHVLHNRGAVVTGVDPVDRSDVAAAFGLDEVVATVSGRWARSLTDATRPDMIVEAVGYQAATLNHAIAAVAYEGVIYHFGGTHEETYAVNFRSLQRRNLTLFTAFTPESARRKALEQAQAYLQEHPDLPERYLTDVYAVADVDAAYRRALVPAPGRLKVGLRWT
jgi:L-iditol 2-dehydrogenase